MSVLRIVANRIKHGAQFLSRPSVRAIAASSWSRRVLNVVYLLLTPSQRALFHESFAKIFRNNHVQGRNGTWKVAFASKNILMPLTSETFWLDWDTAVSIVGHDIEVKQTYESLIGLSSMKPDLFIDIGANYGTHSVLFLMHGIRTITFEPNSSCRDYFSKICELNHLIPTLEPVALGACNGHVELKYPKHDTWLGSTNGEIASSLSLSSELKVEKVTQETLDDYFSEIEHHRTLIKIDTEGNELAVLEGATKILIVVRPLIIFECWPGKQRNKILTFLGSLNYSVYSLPWSPTSKSEPLSPEQFCSNVSANFIAVPKSNSDL